MGASPAQYHRLKINGYPVRFARHKLGINFISTLNYANSGNTWYSK